MFGGPNPYLDTPETETEVEPTDEVEPVASDEAPGTPSSVEEPDVEPTAEVETPDNEVEEEKPEA